MTSPSCKMKWKTVFISSLSNSALPLPLALFLYLYLLVSLLFAKDIMNRTSGTSAQQLQQLQQLQQQQEQQNISNCTSIVQMTPLKSNVDETAFVVQAAWKRMSTSEGEYTRTLVVNTVNKMPKWIVCPLESLWLSLHKPKCEGLLHFNLQTCSQHKSCNWIESWIKIERLNS